MNFNAPSANFHWKLALLGPFNLCVILAHKYFECMELPLNWIYVLVQDLTMLQELRYMCRGVDMRQLTFATAWGLVWNAGWTVTSFWFSFFGINMVFLQDLIYAKPEYCKELNQRLGLS